MKKIIFLISFILGAFFISTVYAADCVRVTGPFADNDVFYASDYENESDNLVSCSNDRLQKAGGTLSGDVIFNGGDVRVYNGGDIIVYSDASTTKEFDVDGATGAINATNIELFNGDVTGSLGASIDGATGKIIGAALKNGTYGLTASLSSGRFQITCNNAACSTSNPAYVVMKSTIGGQQVVLKVSTADHWFDDDNAITSSIVGEEFGVTSGIAWGNIRPFMIYAINTDNTSSGLYFFISPNPAYITSISSAYRGYRGVPATNHSDYNAFFLTATDTTTAAFDSKPVMKVGTTTMVMSTSDDWISYLTISDGINEWGNFQGRKFTFPESQMGSGPNNFFTATSGTPFSWSGDTYYYTIGFDGNVYIDYYSGITGKSSGTVANVFVAIPYIPNGESIRKMKYAGSANMNGLPLGSRNVNILLNNAAKNSAGYLHSIDDGTPLQGSDTTNTDASLLLSFEYKAF